MRDQDTDYAILSGDTVVLRSKAHNGGRGRGKVIRSYPRSDGWADADEHCFDVRWENSQTTETGLLQENLQKVPER
jgi:hypothetical protein